tara:strand:+ start:178 stop:978 length:801 start_codon:yes stop_codon:yes gene_type:complete
MKIEYSFYMASLLNPKSLPFLDYPYPIPFAHRGGAGAFPENTLPAFQNAVNSGYKYLETDVHSSKDGEVFAFHDDSLDRVTEHSGKISDLTSKEISNIQIDGFAKIPTLLELLETFPEAKLNIDPKADSVVQPLTDLLKHTNSVSRVCIGSFSDKRIKHIRKELGSGLCVSAGPKKVVKFIAGKLTFSKFKSDYHCLQVPQRSGPVRIITHDFVKRAHSRGLQVHVWTVDDPYEMNELLDLGVDGLMTDEPSILKNVLIERGEWYE